MKRTVLYSSHIDLEAKIVPFGGWEMPLFYTSPIQEHCFVRDSGGIFDVSHMGRIEIKGKEAGVFLDHLSSRKISNRPVHSATYTLLCNEEGTSIDDLIIYRLDEEHFFLIANASNREVDWNHIKTHATGYDIQLISGYETDSMLAVQGPQADVLMKNVFPKLPEMSPMHVREMDEGIVVATTGYTGAGGYEIFGSHEKIASIWKKLIDLGKKWEIVPVGLAARDSLRLEMGYALYGHELSKDISPLESVAAWAVQIDDRDFIGKEALISMKNNPKRRKPYGVVMEKGAIPREKFSVRYQRQECGVVTSGAFSPTLKEPIALILSDCPLQNGDQVEINIRDQWRKGTISPLPFIRRTT